MGKVVKYCSTCEEGFAEKFGFCPNCGSNLQAFEMNPLGNGKPMEEAKTEPIKTVEPPPPAFIETPAETTRLAETQSFTAAKNEPTGNAPSFELDDEVLEEPVAETKTFEAPAKASNGNGSNGLYGATYAAATNEPVKHAAPQTSVEDFGYRPTLVVEKNVKQRNTLLLGFFAFGCAVMIGSYVYSMFNKFLDIAAIDTGTLLTYVEDVEPPPMELEEPPKKKKDDGGGGGGGGKEEPTPASKGRLATQVDKPFIAPSANMDRLTNPTIAYQASTQGNLKTKQTDENYGLPQGLQGRSDGTGSGGGLGEGRGTGQGTGRGTGLGSGNGSGSGSGNGNGNGSGNGDGDDGDGPQVKPKPTPAPVGPTEGVKILSKPRANYTDAARQNQVQGKVVLRVTFSANGAIGNISVISGLPNGLTEQAIAAARGIRFEPAKRGGVPYAVTKPVEYTFTIY
jgi:TonB family protein